MQFTEMHGYRDFAQLYEVAVRLSNPKQHVDYGKRPLNVLDIQGGNGIVGRLLQRDLEDRVNYTNVDKDEDVLKQSPGITLKADSNFLRAKLGDDKFDYIFCLNHDTYVWIPYFADTKNPFAEQYVDVERIKGLMTTIQLLQVAIYLRKGGAFIKGGLMIDENLEAFAKFFQDFGTGIELKDTETLPPLSEKTARDLTSYDTRRIIGYGLDPASHQYKKVPEKEIKKIIEELAKHQRILKVASFRRVNDAQNMDGLVAELIRYEESLSAHFEEIMDIDRFGPW